MERRARTGCVNGNFGVATRRGARPMLTQWLKKIVTIFIDGHKEVTGAFSL